QKAGGQPMPSCCVTGSEHFQVVTTVSASICLNVNVNDNVRPSAAALSHSGSTNVRCQQCFLLRINGCGIPLVVWFVCLQFETVAGRLQNIRSQNASSAKSGGRKSTSSHTALTAALCTIW
ncbi:unnamed protein product, partial [Ceratitis capitata]